MFYRFQSYLLFAGLVFVLMFGGCASQQSAVVATIGGDKITLDEFKYNVCEKQRRERHRAKISF